MTGQRQAVKGEMCCFLLGSIRRRHPLPHPLPVLALLTSKSLWLCTDQYCLEDEGALAGVCDEEDG